MWAGRIGRRYHQFSHAQACVYTIDTWGAPSTGALYGPQNLVCTLQALAYR